MQQAGLSKAKLKIPYWLFLEGFPLLLLQIITMLVYSLQSLNKISKMANKNPGTHFQNVQTPEPSTLKGKVWAKLDYNPFVRGLAGWLVKSVKYVY